MVLAKSLILRKAILTNSLRNKYLDIKSNGKNILAGSAAVQCIVFNILAIMLEGAKGRKEVAGWQSVCQWSVVQRRATEGGN